MHAMNTRAKGNKMYHLIVSLREGDDPTRAARAIERDGGGLGLWRPPAVVGRRSDTDHLHLHLGISKIHPTTFAWSSRTATTMRCRPPAGSSSSLRAAS